MDHQSCGMKLFRAFAGAHKRFSDFKYIGGIAMSNLKKDEKDPGLCGNERIEAAIAGLQQETSQEHLAHTLTVIRQRMREGGQLIIAVEPRTVTEDFGFRQSGPRMEETGGRYLPALMRS